jgi:hypothetical protein
MKAASKLARFDELVAIPCCIICEDFIVSVDGTWSIIKAFDQLNVTGLPVKATRVRLLLEFMQRTGVSLSDIQKLHSELFISVIPPQGEATETPAIKPFDHLDSVKNATLHRVVCDLTGFVFDAFGRYTIRAIVKVKGQPDVFVGERYVKVVDARPEGERAESGKADRARAKRTTKPKASAAKKAKNK